MRCRRSEWLLIALLAAGDASATVHHFSLSNEAPTNQEGEIELEGWLDFGRAPGGGANGMLWAGVRAGLLENVELASFVVFEKSEYPEVVGSTETSGLMMWATELRWRPVEVGKWPVDVFVQGQMFYWFQLFHPIQFRLTLGLSRTFGRLIVAGNVSVWLSPTFNNPAGKTTSWDWMDASLGASVNLLEADGAIPNTSLGLEAWSLFPVVGGIAVHNHLLTFGGVVIGPTLSLARGRLWLTGHLGFPVYGVGGFELRTPLVARMMMGISI